MVSPRILPFIRVVSALILLFLAWDKSIAQCNPPDQVPTIECETAPLVCLENACYQTLNIPNQGYPGFCGPNTLVHNPQYFEFIPTASDIEIHIHVDNCDSGAGLQSAIIGECPWDVSDVLTCDPGTPPGGTMVLVLSGLVIGQSYWLLIDGSNGATCDYTIDYVSGIFSPGLDGEVTDGQAIPDYVCQGYEGVVLEASPPVGNAHGYYWVLEWSGDTITSTLPETTIDIPANTPPGVYEICVRAFSGCDTMDNEVCFDLEVYEIPPEERDPEYFCPEEFPFNWGSVFISGPGDYAQTFSTPEGCTFDSTWTVEEYPEVPLGELDTLHCGESLIYENEFYDAAGTYDLSYPGMGLNGCDSMAEINITLAYIEAFIELTCENGEFVLTPQVQERIPFNADIDWEWFEAGVLIFDNIPLLLTVDGCYDLYATVITNAGSCTYFIETFCFDADDYRPVPPNLGFLDTLVCAQPGIIFEVIEDPFGEPVTEYVWSGPANVPIDQNGSNIATFDFTNAGPSEICVYAINECGPGEPTCFNVDIKPTPVADFSYDLDICADSTMVVTFTGTASPDAEIIWNFDSPSSITGSGTGPYVVSWSISGAKLIELTVIEPGCDTSYNSGIVTVSSYQPPVINCTSTINSVHFQWLPVPGINTYLVSIDGAPAIRIDSTDFEVKPLAPGTVVIITITIDEADPCDDIVVTGMCTAEDCPPPAIVLSGQDSACLNNPTIIDLDALVNGNPGVGTWGGPGIVDPTAGLFDPKFATSGQHQVTFTTDINGCDFTEPYLITVFDSITADFVIDPVICITDVANLSYTGNASGSATYNYTFTPATVVAGSGAGPYQLSWNTPGPKTVRLQISENGCTSDLISQNTNVVATLNPAVINCAPNTSGILFSWTTDPAGTGVIPSTLIGPAGTLAGNTWNFSGLTPGDTVQIEIVTQSAGPCPGIADTLLCIARQCPLIGLMIDPVPDICLYPGTGTVDLDVTITNQNGGVGDWSGPGITDAVNGIFNPVIAGAGGHQITYHYLEDGCDFNESITINVSDLPGAFISNTDLMITCATNSLILDGSGSSGGSLTYLWTTATGSILNGATTAMAEAGKEGVYQLLVTNSAGCKDSTSVSVTVDANIPTAVAGPDKTITCDSTQFVLGGNSTSGVNIIYTWSTTGGNIIGSTNGKQVTADRIGLYTITVRDTLTGCQNSDQAEIFLDTDVADIVLLAGDTIDCNTSISTAESMLSEPVNDYDLSWSTLDGTIVGNTTGSDIDISQGGTYTLSIRNKDNGCTNSEDVFIPESDEIIDAVDVSLRNIICNGDDNGALTIDSVYGGTSPYTYTWSVSPQGGTMLTSLSPGQYSLTVSDQNGCSIVQSYTITEPDLVTLDIGPNMTVAARDSVSLSISTNLAPGATSLIDWGGYDGLFCPGCPKFEFIATTSATISAMVVDTAGCTALDSMRLTVIVPRIIYIPNLFSPNGDGLNDYFTISGRFNLINIKYLRIFDRWGNQLFERNNLTPGIPEIGWDGMFNNEPMQPGVYVYIAELEYEDGKSETVNGDITIMR